MSITSVIKTTVADWFSKEEQTEPTFHESLAVLYDEVDQLEAVAKKCAADVQKLDDDIALAKMEREYIEDQGKQAHKLATKLQALLDV